MAYNTPPSVTTGQLATASAHNTYTKDNIIALRVGEIALTSQAALDFIYASSSSQLARLAAVALKSPRLNAGGSAWEMVFAGAGVHELYLPISAFRPHTSGGCGSLEDILIAAGIYVSASPFAAAGTPSATLSYPFPKSWNEGTITFQPYWFNNAGGAGTVIWELSGVSMGDNETLSTAVGTIQSSTDTALAANNLAIGPESAAMTLAGTPVTSDNSRLVIRRNAGTYASSAYLLGIKIRLTVDASSDD